MYTKTDYKAKVEEKLFIRYFYNVFNISCCKINTRHTWTREIRLIMYGFIKMILLAMSQTHNFNWKLIDPTHY